MCEWLVGWVSLHLYVCMHMLYFYGVNGMVMDNGLSWTSQLQTEAVLLSVAWGEVVLYGNCGVLFCYFVIHFNQKIIGLCDVLAQCR